MQKKILNKRILKGIKIFFIVLAVLFVLPFMLYIPPIQTFIKDIATEKASKALNMSISVDRLLLRFPLNIEVDGVLILDAQKDTLISAGEFTADVALIPLFTLKIDLNSATLNNGVYKMLSADSSMYLSSKVDLCEIKNASIDLKNNYIRLNEAYLKGGDILLHFENEKAKPTPKDSTESAPWIIEASKIDIEKVHYSMQMLPTIDNLDAYIKKGLLKNGKVDTGKYRINVRYLGIDGVDAEYLTPSEEYLATNPIKETKDTVSTSTGESWVIQGKRISLTNANGIYAMRGHKPSTGIDFNNLQVRSLDFLIEDFYNKGVEIKVPIKSLSAQERCGLEITSASGLFNMDSTSMSVTDWNISTGNSILKCNAYADMGIFDKDNSAKIDIQASSIIKLTDISALYPFTAKYINQFHKRTSLKADIDISGTLGKLDIKKIEFNVPNYSRVLLSGNCQRMLSERNRWAKINVAGKFNNLNWAKSTFIPASLQKDIAIPALSIDGSIGLHGSETSGFITLATKAGEIKLDGTLSGNIEKYDISLNMNQFPIDAILPTSGFKSITGTLDATGKGFNPLSKGSALTCELNIESLGLNKNTFEAVSAKVDIAEGNANLVFDSQNKFADLFAEINTTIDNDKYDYTLDANIKDININELGFTSSPLAFSGIFNSIGKIDLKNNCYDLTSDLTKFNANYENIKFNTDDINFKLYSTKDSTSLKYAESDANINFITPNELNSFLSQISKCSDIISKHLKKYSLNFDEINDSLPLFFLDINMGNNNLISQYLKNKNIEFNDFNLLTKHDSIIELNGKILALNANGLNIDTITVNAKEHGSDLLYNIHTGNRKGNMDQFAKSDITGKIGNNQLDLLFVQYNVNNQQGFNFGFSGKTEDNNLYLNLYPANPIIGFREWTLNADNYIEYNFNTKHIDANLKLENSNGFVSLETKHRSDSVQEDILLKIKGIELGEWINMSPLAPPIKGALNADATLHREKNNFLGNGSFSLNNFFYDKKNVGDIGFDLNLDVNPSTGLNEANASVSFNGTKSIFIKGAVNDSTPHSPYQMSVLLDRLPLTVANPFISSGMAQFGGYINGKMTMKGSASNPILNGYIECDSSMVKIPMFGSKLNFSTSKIQVDSSVIKLNNFKLSGSNNNPLLINGKVNLLTLDNPYLNLTLEGKRVQIVDSKKSSNSQIYGKGYVDLWSNVSGKLSQLNVNANLSILEGTNATYVYQSNVNEITKQQVGNLVKFVQFNDTTNLDNNKNIDPGFSMNLNANLNIMPGSTLNIDLSPEGKDHVQVGGTGNLNFTMDSFGDSRLVGKYTINNGFARYSPPLISEKNFTFTPGSYIAWTGDILNPTLNISATGKQTSTVIIEGSNPARVNFVIGAKITNTLNNMGVSFDLTAENNMTIQSELLSMSPEQRSTQAMNLMLYNNYTGSLSSTASAPNTNMLYSFLSSQLNSWASKMVKGVDISFGINEYNTGQSSNAATGMNYSYQISKTLFDNRFKMTVGGNYDTTNNATDNSIAQNLLNNISFEYSITPSGAMAIKIYSHLTDNNIFQSQVTETGAAFILRRKIVTFKDLFKFNFKNIFTSAQSQK